MEELTNPVYTDPRHGKSREMIYAYDEHGNFVKEVKFHGEPDRVLVQQCWDVFNERIEQARKNVLAGKVSPITYYMEKNLVDPMALSMQAGISILRVKLHLKPFFFKRLSGKTLQKYANAFNITVDELKNVK